MAESDLTFNLQAQPADDLPMYLGRQVCGFMWTGSDDNATTATTNTTINNNVNFFYLMDKNLEGSCPSNKKLLWYLRTMEWPQFWDSVDNN